jgi:hypothetical protein
MIPGALYCSMKGINFNNIGRACPDCGKQTDAIKLGSEPAREVCGHFGCEWDGVTLE